MKPTLDTGFMGAARHEPDLPFECPVFSIWFSNCVHLLGVLVGMGVLKQQNGGERSSAIVSDTKYCAAPPLLRAATVIYLNCVPLRV